MAEKAPPGSVTEALMKVLHTQFPKLALFSGYRPGATTISGKKSMHAAAKAVDIPPDPVVFDWIAANYPNSFELIFSPKGDKQIYKGKPHVYTGGVKAQHYDHIHWSMQEAPGAPAGGGSPSVDGVTPVSLTNPLDAFKSFIEFFTKDRGATRLAMIVVGIALIGLSVRIALIGSKVQKTAEKAIVKTFTKGAV